MFKSPRHVFLLMALAVVLASVPAGIGITAQQSNSVQWFEIGLDLNMERGFGVWRSFPIAE